MVRSDRSPAHRRKAGRSPTRSATGARNASESRSIPVGVKWQASMKRAGSVSRSWTSTRLMPWRAGNSTRGGVWRGGAGGAEGGVGGGGQRRVVVEGLVLRGPVRAERRHLAQPAQPVLAVDAAHPEVQDLYGQPRPAAAQLRLEERRVGLVVGAPGHGGGAADA